MMDQPDFRADLSRSGISRYIQLATLFRRRIESGQWPRGARIPTIDQLAHEFGVARATIRQSLGLLSHEGLIVSFRAKGTFVAERLPAPLWCEVTTDWDGLLMNREGGEIAILKDYAGAPAPYTPEPTGVVQPHYRHLRRLHSRSGKPYLLSDMYVEEQLAGKMPQDALEQDTALRLAERLPGVRIAAARQRLTIGMADVETSQLLQIPLNGPVCHVDRFALDQRGRLVVMALGTYRGDVVRMDIRLR